MYNMQKRRISKRFNAIESTIFLDSDVLFNSSLTNYTCSNNAYLLKQENAQTRKTSDRLQNIR